MSIQKRILAATTGMILCLYSMLAFAVYGQQVIIRSNDASAMQSQTISFTTASGQTADAEIESYEDGRMVVNLRFDGNRINGRSEGGLITIGQGADAIPIALPGASPDEIILVDLDRGTARAQPRPAPPDSATAPGWTFGVGGLASDLTTPEIGTSGVISEGGSESFNLRGIDSVDLVGGNIFLSRNLGGSRNTGLFGGIRFGSADDQIASDVPTMTMDTALVFTDFIQGITGIGIFPVGVQSSVDVDIDVTEGRFGLQRDLLRKPGKRYRMATIFEVMYGELEIKQNSVDTLTDPSFGGMDPSVTRNQILDQSYFELYAGLRVTRETSDNFAWYAEAGPIIRSLDADWTSMERVQCAICGAPLIDTSVERRDSESGISVGAKVQIGVELQVSEHASLEAGAFYRGGTDNAAPINPQSGDDLAIRDQPSYLSTDTSSEYGLQVRLLFHF